MSPRAASIAARLAAQNHSLHLRPDTHPTVASGYAAQMRLTASLLGANRSAVFNLVSFGRTDVFGVLNCLHLLSRGSVSLDPSDPAGRPPLVDYGALANPLDAAVLADLLRYARRYLFDNPSNAGFGPLEYSPGSAVRSDADIASWLAREGLRPTMYHPSGTAAMLPRALGGVVDASMMPLLVGANTCLTVYAVAEKVRSTGAFCSTLW